MREILMVQVVFQNDKNKFLISNLLKGFFFFFFIFFFLGGGAILLGLFLLLRQFLVVKSKGTPWFGSIYDDAE